MPNWSKEYCTILEVDVEICSVIDIQFANGDLVSVKASTIIPAGYRVFWEDRPKIIDGGRAIVFSATPKRLEVSWELIRRLTDVRFAKRMAKLAAKQSKHIGKRLRGLRKNRGLTQADIALRTGIEPANISRIENGKFDIAASTLWKILGAMGYSAGDLAEPNPHKEKEMDNG